MKFRFKKMSGKHSFFILLVIGVLTVDRVQNITVTLENPTETLITVRENTETIFVCTASDGLLVPSVRWYKDQRTTATTDDIDITGFASESTNKTNNHIVFVTSTLRYLPQKDDNGVRVYCTANSSDNFLTSTRKPQLNVLYSPDGPPSIQGFNNGDTYRIIENSQVRLRCLSQGGKPHATLSWNCYNSGLASVTNGNTVVNDVTWTAIRGPDRSCTCLSSHVVAGNQTVLVNVQILYPPDVPVIKNSGKIVSSNRMTFMEGISVSLTCESSGNPLPNNYIWTKDGRTISNGKMLLFSNIDRRDSGQYSCKVQNTMSPIYGRQVTGINSTFVNITVSYDKNPSIVG